MRERTWHKRDDRAMQVVTRQTSRSRCWTGFVAMLLDESDGFTQTPFFPSNNVSMLVGAPVVHTSVCDGSVSRRLRVAGDIDVVPASFGGAWENEGPTSFLVVNLSPFLLDTAAEALGIGRDRFSIAPQLQLRDPQLEHICWALAAELESPDFLGRLYADSLGLALSAHLLRRYAPVVPRRLTGGLPKRRLQRVTDYIREHLAHDLTLAELAGVANMSPSHFKFLFKQSVGVPVHKYVVRSRVDYAIELLSRSSLPLSDVALQAGFANQSHMARCMRRISGMTPGDLRHER